MTNLECDNSVYCYCSQERTNHLAREYNLNRMLDVRLQAFDPHVKKTVDKKKKKGIIKFHLVVLPYK